MADETLDQSWLKKLRNRPLIAATIVAAIVLGGLASTTKAVRDLIEVFFPKTSETPAASPGQGALSTSARSTRELVVGRWLWGTYSDGGKLWVTVHSDGTLESTISLINPDGTQTENVNNTGTWTVVKDNPPSYELHWASSAGNYVFTNFVSLSSDGKQLWEIDKGKQDRSRNTLVAYVRCCRTSRAVDNWS
jgi:hypothetical protein